MREERESRLKEQAGYSGHVRVWSRGHSYCRALEN